MNFLEPPIGLKILSTSLLTIFPVLKHIRFDHKHDFEPESKYFHKLRQIINFHASFNQTEYSGELGRLTQSGAYYEENVGSNSIPNDLYELVLKKNGSNHKVLKNYARYLFDKNMTGSGEIYARICYLKPDLFHICEYSDKLIDTELKSEFGPVNRAKIDDMTRMVDFISKKGVKPVTKEQWITEYTLMIQNGHFSDFVNQVPLSRVPKLNQLRQVVRSSEETGWISFIGKSDSFNGNSGVFNPPRTLNKRLILELYSSFYESNILGVGSGMKFVGGSGRTERQNSWDGEISAKYTKVSPFRTRWTSVPGQVQCD